MKKILLIISLFVMTNNVFAVNGNFAGGFMDGFNKGMASGGSAAASEQALIQQRIELRDKYGTRELLRMNTLEKQSDYRIREIFEELSSPSRTGNPK
jgi:hypothetical protein